MDMYMTKLDPNKHYVYERVDNKIYAREMNSLNRILISEHGNYWEDRNRLIEILIFARTNPMLQEELDRVIVLYHLLKQQDSVDHHPV